MAQARAGPRILRIEAASNKAVSLRKKGSIAALVDSAHMRRK